MFNLSTVDDSIQMYIYIKKLNCQLFLCFGLLTDTLEVLTFYSEFQKQTLITKKLVVAPTNQYSAFWNPVGVVKSFNNNYLKTIFWKSNWEKKIFYFSETSSQLRISSEEVRFTWVFANFLCWLCKISVTFNSISIHADN